METFGEKICAEACSGKGDSGFTEEEKMMMMMMNMMTRLARSYLPPIVNMLFVCLLGKANSTTS